MRSDRRREQEKSRKDGFARATGRWAVIFLIITVIFCVGMALSRLFSAKFLAIGGAVLLLILILVIPPLKVRRFKQSRRVIALAVSILMTAVYCLGGFYIFGALDFIGNITSMVEVESYYVVVRDDDEFQDIKDIAGEQVIAYRSGEGFSDAEAELMKAVDCSIVDSDDLTTMVDSLLNGESNVLLMNSANYISVSDKRKEEFEDYTKILDVIRVHVKKESFAKNVKVTSQPFNIMITGLDVDGSINTESRSDVNIVATVNPVTKEVLLTSIPRDYYVQLPGFGSNAYDKLTHTGLYGADETVAAVEALLGIDINYYVKVNYSTVVRVVDAIGGIDVYSDFEFTTNGQNWFYFEQGDIHLDGQEALAFARERQAFEDGDFQRNRNQQKVLAAIIKKMTSSTALLTRYTEILGAVSENLEMNMSAEDIKALVRMQTADMAGWNIESQSIIGELDLLPCYALGGEYASVVRADLASMEDAKAKIFQTMGKTYEPDYDEAGWDYYPPDMVSGLDQPDDTGIDYYQSGSGESEWAGDTGEGEGAGDSGETGWSEGSGDSGESDWSGDTGDSGESGWSEGSGDTGEGDWSEGSGDTGEGDWSGESGDSGESGEGDYSMPEGLPASHSFTVSRE